MITWRLLPVQRFNRLGDRWRLDGKFGAMAIVVYCS
jgi:hypothetical protein